MSTAIRYTPSTFIPLMPPVGNGISDQSKVIGLHFENVAKSALQTASIGFSKQKASEAFFEAIYEAVNEEWEGYGGKVISPLVIVSALMFIKLLPTDLPTPEITIDPDGEVLFEWYHSPYRVFSVSVGASGKSVYAGLLGDERTHGTSSFASKFPRLFLEAIKKVYAIG